MKQFSGTLLLIAMILNGVNAQHIVMDLGGPSHSGVFNTRPLRNYSKILWKTDLKSYGYMNCIIDDGILYVSGLSYNSDLNKIIGHLFAIRSGDGSIKWQNTIDQNISSPVLKDSVLFYGSDDKNGKQYAVDVNTGHVLWDFSTALASCWPPAIVGDYNYFGSHGNMFYVVNNTTGDLVLDRIVEGGICCCPSVVGDVIYFTDLRGKLRAYSTKENKDIWVFESGEGSNNPPAIVNGVAYMINKGGTLYAIDTKTGKLKWSYKTDDSMFRSPAINDTIATVITTNGHLYAFDTTDGTVLWETRKPGLGYTNTAICDDIVYVGCADRHLYAFKLKTGQELWNVETDAPVNTPLIDNGVVYFTSGNYLYAIK